MLGLNILKYINIMRMNYWLEVKSAFWYVILTWIWNPLCCIMQKIFNGNWYRRTRNICTCYYLLLIWYLPYPLFAALKKHSMVFGKGELGVYVQFFFQCECCIYAHHKHKNYQWKFSHELPLKKYFPLQARICLIWDEQFILHHSFILESPNIYSNLMQQMTIEHFSQRASILQRYTIEFGISVIWKISLLGY